jgi:hypothetical protein
VLGELFSSARDPGLAKGAKMGSDPFIIITEVSARLYEQTGHRGPGCRKLRELCADALLTPPMERRNGRWGCAESKIPELAELLGLQVKTLPSVSAQRARAPSEVTNQEITT